MSDTSFRAQIFKWSRDYDSLYIIRFGDDTAWSNNLYIKFYKQPSSAGTYKIVHRPDADDEASIEEWQLNSHSSYSDDENGGTLYVKIESGKLNFNAAEVKLKHDNFVYISHRTCSLNLAEW